LSVKPNENQEEKTYRLNSLKKLSFDVFYYSVITIAGYVSFMNEPWFPWMLGGSGSCDKIYQHYPNWPI